MTREPAVKRRQAQAGFTLVELMVVVAIIAILAAIVGVNVLGALDTASSAQ
ncbi:MAG: prepilin-type N-terminal cleavage/methylation domain-containing protein, partial [Nitrospiraceae bacterium]|nr:prepilin-type N-terminal cleavage/methylation domain-containing protein [Nitrospiraceae bacterium]